MRLSTETVFHAYPLVSGQHSSGGIAAVKDGTYHCFKGCWRLKEFLPNHPVPLTREVAELANWQMGIDVNKQYLDFGELQYRDVPRRILVEQQLNMEEIKDVTQWYIANGRPIFASMECPSQLDTYQEDRRRTIRSPSFAELPDAKDDAPPCDGGGSGIPKPKMWDRMRKVAEEVAPYLGARVTRVDLYASDAQVFFSGTYRELHLVPCQ